MKKPQTPAPYIRAVSLLIFLGGLIAHCFAAPGDVDLSFDPGSGVNGEVKTMALQPDGKVIVGGTFTTVNGLARFNLARLNANGSGDASFDAGTNADEHLSAVAVQPDGKVIFTRDFSILSGAPAGHKVARLNADGSLDNSFVPTLIAFPSSSAFTCMAVQPDGRIVLGGYSTQIDDFGNLYPSSILIRLTANGALDNTFTNGNGTFDGPSGGRIASLSLQPDGRILIAGTIATSVNGTTHYSLIRLNADGTVDPNFDSVGGIIKSVGLQSDGRILLAGYSIGNDPTWNAVVRLNADGSIDQTFQAGTDGNSSLISFVVQPDGKVICIGAYVYVNGTNRNGLVRLNPNGGVDGSFNPGTDVPNNAIAAIALQDDGRILIGGGFTLVNDKNRERLARLNSDGTLDAAFNPGSSINAGVNSLAIQSDGKVVLGGDFTMAGGTRRNRIARLNANGTLDTAFNPGGGPAGPYNGSLRVAAVAMQPNGKVLVGGDFSSFNGISRNRLARLNADGAVDISFVPWVGAPTVNYAFQPAAFAVQPDGKILVGGNAAFGSGNDGNGLARLNADGSFDTSFHPDTISTTGGDYAVISSLAQQADGKILAGGYFVQSDTPRFLLIRLNANGSRDPNFPAAGGSAGVTSIVLQPDGRILAGGWHGAGGWITRSNSNGSLDKTFNNGSLADNSINSVLVQPDGKILVAGSFTTLNGAKINRIGRLNPDGSVDGVFNPGSGWVGILRSSVLQPDGSVLIAGDFTAVSGAVRPRIARLYGDSALPFLSIRASGGFAVLSWPGAFANLQLQESIGLSESNGWSPVLAPRSTDSGLISVSVPMNDSRKFFRLSSP